MADLALVIEIEEIGEHAIVGQRADGERRHEFLCRPRQHGAHGDLPLGQPADEIEALVGGNAAADDEQDAFGQLGGVPRRCALCNSYICSNLQDTQISGGH